VAQHALTVYRRFTSAPEWKEFFSEMERRRDDLLATQALDFDTFLEDYNVVGMGDRWSLIFCYGCQKPNLLARYRAELHGTREQTDAGLVHGGWLEITPDPFDGEAVRLDVPARCVPARRYASDDDLREAVARADRPPYRRSQRRGARSDLMSRVLAAGYRLLLLRTSESELRV
jgi:hypothetical protein